MSRPVRIGLTGGIASGKSTVAGMFAYLGARVLDADAIGHEVLNEIETMKSIRALWGNSVFYGSDVNRKALATFVFQGVDAAKQRMQLERITHPRIKQIMLERLRQAEQDGVVAVVIDAPLLFEAGWDALCDYLVFVEAKFENRRRRIQQRGWTDAEFKQREQAQFTVQEKQRRCTITIDNSEDTATTLDQVVDLWKSLDLHKLANSND